MTKSPTKVGCTPEVGQVGLGEMAHPSQQLHPLPANTTPHLSPVRYLGDERMIYAASSTPNIVTILRIAGIGLFRLL